jgi:SAM-dependent methyltransferase
MSSSELSPEARRNREHWDATADEYQSRHGDFIGRREPRWGVWQIAEDELRILGDVAGRDVLELGCGAAHWSILLAERGARPVGLDNSEHQLEHAQAALEAAGLDFPLVHASAEEVPLPNASFDVVFCDHGALSWADPYRVVPEAARLLRPAGLLAFSTTSPLATLCFHPETDVVEPTLHRDYFGLHHLDEQSGFNFQLPYGEWIRVLVDAGLVIEALVEPRPGADAASTYWDPSELEWARRWPSETIWKARKP